MLNTSYTAILENIFTISYAEKFKLMSNIVWGNVYISEVIKYRYFASVALKIMNLAIQMYTLLLEQAKVQKTNNPHYWVKDFPPLILQDLSFQLSQWTLKQVFTSFTSIVIAYYFCFETFSELPWLDLLLYNYHSFIPLAPSTSPVIKICCSTHFLDFGPVLWIRGCAEARACVSHPALRSHSRPGTMTNDGPPHCWLPVSAASWYLVILNTTHLLDNSISFF